MIRQFFCDKSALVHEQISDYYNINQKVMGKFLSPTIKHKTDT